MFRHNFFSYLMSHLCCMATTFPTDAKSRLGFDLDLSRIFIKMDLTWTLIIILKCCGLGFDLTWNLLRWTLLNLGSFYESGLGLDLTWCKAIQTWTWELLDSHIIDSHWLQWNCLKSFMVHHIIHLLSSSQKVRIHPETYFCEHCRILEYRTLAFYTIYVYG